MEKGEPIEAVLIDTDGKLAEEHLTQKGALAGRSSGARAVHSADALIFLVDPTKGATQFEKEFQQFCGFVENLETTRSQRTEIAGLPIYLVLTKCDAYGKPTDPTGTWVQKIEDAKRKVDKRYQETEAKFPYADDLPFGKVDVRVWATAVKRPALADRPAKSQEPYGVAELFRQCLKSAHDFHHQRNSARTRLQIVLFGFVSLIFVLLAAGGLFFVTRPSAEITMMEGSLREVLPREKGNAAELLKEPLSERIVKLTALLANPDFAKLPGEKQDEARKALKEMEKYVEINTLLQKEVSDPRSAINEQDVDKIAAALDLVQLELPKEYKEAWQETKLVKKMAHFRQEADLLSTAASALETWYIRQKKVGEKLGLESNAFAPREERRAWLQRAQDFLDRTKAPVADQDRLVEVRFSWKGGDNKSGIVGAVIKRAHVERGLVVATAEQKEQTMRTAKDLKVLDAAGKELPGGLGAKQLQEGTDVMLTVDRQEPRPVVKVIRLVDEPAFMNMLNILGPQPTWFNVKRMEVDWLLDKDLAGTIKDAHSLKKVLSEKFAEKAKKDAEPRPEEKFDKRFEKQLQNLAEYAVSVSTSLTISYANVSRFPNVSNARRNLKITRDKLLGQQKNIEDSLNQ